MSGRSRRQPLLNARHPLPPVTEASCGERLLLVESFGVEEPKTRAVIAKLRELDFDRGLIVVEAFDRNLWLATRNLPDVFCLDAAEIDPLSLVGSDRVIMTAAAAKLIEERIG